MRNVRPSNFSFGNAAASLRYAQAESPSDSFLMKKEGASYRRFGRCERRFRFRFSEFQPSDDLPKVCLCHFGGEHSLVPMLDPSCSPMFLCSNVESAISWAGRGLGTRTRSTPH